MLNNKDYFPGGITMETNDGTGAFHYNATMDSIVSPHTNGSIAQTSQMVHQGYDTASGQKIVGEESEIYSDASKRNDQMQGNLMQNNFASNMETAEMYQQQVDVQNNEEYPVNDSNMETYMMEHDQNQYEYDPSQYSEEQYDNQFNMMADQTENNQSST